MMRHPLFTTLAIGFLALSAGVLTNALRRHPLPLLRPLPPLMEGDISVGRAAQVLERREATFIDVRSEEAFARAHVPGAQPWREQVLKGKVIVYCSSSLCPKAHNLADRLRERGLDVLVMHEGIKGWAAQGMPLASGSKP